MATGRGRHRRGQGRGTLTLVLGILCLLGGGALVANVVYYKHHTAAAGRALVRDIQHDLDQQAASPAPGCTAVPAPQRKGRAFGVLDVPRLGLSAPVLEGVDERQLSVAVGHLPTSVPPGQQGTSVLAAHDVTWFSHIDKLQAGDEVLFRHGCVVDTYRVHTHKVVNKGTPLVNASSPEIVLETCWPTTALYWTNQRYLVFASFASSTTADKEASLGVASGLPQLVPAAVNELADRSYGAPMGTLTFAGKPSASWRQSSAPLAIAHAAKQNHLAGLQAVSDASDSEWRTLVGSALKRPALVHPGEGQVEDYVSNLDITITATGSTVSDVMTHAVVSLTGQGTYDLTTHQHLSHNRLTVTRWTMTLAGEPATPTPKATASTSAVASPSPHRSTATAAPKTASSPAPTPRTTAATPSPSPSRTPPPSPTPNVPESSTPTPAPQPS